MDSADTITASPAIAGRARPSRRWIVFVHQDGLLLSTTLSALEELGILQPSLEGAHRLDKLYPAITDRGFGYMRVGLRCLASQGWLDAQPTLDANTTVLSWTEAGRHVARCWDRYLGVGRFLSSFLGNSAGTWSSDWNANQTELFLELVPLACQRWHLDRDLPPELRALTATHLDAGLVVPSMLWLRHAGLLGAEGPLLPRSAVGDGIGELFTALGWIDRDAHAWTAEGGEVAALAVHFGMAASYLPLLGRLPNLYRGEVVVGPGAEGAEWHVHRELNVIASGAAHRRYFADADKIFVELFNREPVEAQPRFIADMGCGDGSWLVHLYELVSEHTARGERLRDHPLLMVGLDYNAAALKAADRMVSAAGIPALLLRGDISDPDQLSTALAEHGLAIEDGLHVRAFIDHNRSYIGAPSGIAVRGSSSGAYVDRDGCPLDPAAVEADFVLHLRRWASHVRKHGIVMLEAHCVAPQIARKHLGATHAVAFDAYHGYSHQYPLEHSAFLRCCREAGLRPASDCERRYPANRPFVAVSLNRLLVPEREEALVDRSGQEARNDTWRPDSGVDLEDGRALHRLLYVDGDTRYPRLWCSAATGFVVSGALDVVEDRLSHARPGDVIRVLDYGAGTGLATIEFLKACRQRSIDKRLERLGAKLEVHLVDLPSAWFAQGFELLRDCALTQFHSLSASGGGFRPLEDVTGGELMDAVMANMVFHLIPRSALRRVAAQLAGITAPGGRLVWSSPDLGPPGPYAVLFHDANRALRQRWLDLLQSDTLRSDGGTYDRPLSPRLHRALEEVRARADAASIQEAEARANRRVLPAANTADDVADALAGCFMGDAKLVLETYELLVQDVVDTLLVPSNQEEYLSEIVDRELREDVIRELMLSDVLPRMQGQAAGTAEGLNVQWTLGSVVKTS